MLRRIKLHTLLDEGLPTDDQPWVADWRSYDLPETISKGIYNAAPGCIAITLSMLGGPLMITAAEEAAHARGMRVLWWFGPSSAELTDSGKAYLRNCVKTARHIIQQKAVPV